MQLTSNTKVQRHTQAQAGNLFRMRACRCRPNETLIAADIAGLTVSTRCRVCCKHIYTNALRSERDNVRRSAFVSRTTLRVSPKLIGLVFLFTFEQQSRLCVAISKVL